MKRVNMHEAKTHLLRLVDEAAAGQSFVICKAGKPMVRVTPLAQAGDAAPVSSRLGLLKGLVSVPDDFDRMSQEEMPTCLKGLPRAECSCCWTPICWCGPWGSPSVWIQSWFACWKTP